MSRRWAQWWRVTQPYLFSLTFDSCISLYYLLCLPVLFTLIYRLGVVGLCCGNFYLFSLSFVFVFLSLFWYRVLIFSVFFPFLSLLSTVFFICHNYWPLFLVFLSFIVFIFTCHSYFYLHIYLYLSYLPLPISTFTCNIYLTYISTFTHHIYLYPSCLPLPIISTFAYDIHLYLHIYLSSSPHFIPSQTVLPHPIP